MPNLTQSYSWAVTQCNAENVGYSETYRNQQVDPSTGATCYDCSSFIWYALHAGGFDLASAGSATAFTTSTMLPVLSSLGFVEQDISGHGCLETLSGWSRPVSSIQKWYIVPMQEHL